MKRRSFLELLASSTMALTVDHPSTARPGAPDVLARRALDTLESAFRTPDGAALPKTYWPWLNGNVTRAGITLDLEAMQRMGLGGAYPFDVGIGIPRGPVDYGSEEWLELLHHAAVEAARLGLTLNIFNAPGYSGTGGPWVPPRLAMQQLVWTETLVTGGGGAGGIRLGQPLTKLGYYRDAHVLAFAAAEVERVSMRDTLTRVFVDGESVEPAVLLDRNPDSVLRIEPGGDRPATLTWQLSQPFEARAITVLRRPEPPANPYDGPRDDPPILTLEASSDGTTFTPVCNLYMPALRKMTAPGAQSFAPVTATWWRLISDRPTSIVEIELHAASRLPGWPVKTNCALANPHALEPVQTFDSVAVDPGAVIDLSGKLDTDGRLDWEPPPGRWVVLRLGHTPTGQEVGAAPDSAVGLDVDKFRREAVDLHFDKFLARVLERLRPYLGRTMQGIHIDSWEAGRQNWCVDFTGIFLERRGYSLVPYLPAMTGRIVTDPEVTEKVLYDVRKTQAELVADNYYGHMRRRCKEFGLSLSAEPYGDGPFEGVDIGARVDGIFGEFWTRYTYAADRHVREAVSAARSNGMSLIGAEAFTGEPRTSRWTEHPYALKAQGDWMFALGINQLLFHTFAHQPHPSAVPGMTMGPFGAHLDRNETWAPEAQVWTRYLARVQAVLQQGQPVADIALLKIPSLPAPDVSTATPEGFAADVIGVDALLNRSQVQQGRLVITGSGDYACLVIDSAARMSVALLRKLRALSAEGATIVGVADPPTGSPSLSDGPGADQEVRRLAKALWGSSAEGGTGPRLRTVRMIDGSSLAPILRDLGVQPDVEITSRNPDAALHWAHRRVGDADVYWIANSLRRQEQVVCSFRMCGRCPEVWRPDVGSAAPTPLYETRDKRTYVPLLLDPAGAVFVVFRRPAPEHGWAAVLRDGARVLGTSVTTLPRRSAAHEFTITQWVQPETTVLPGRGFLIFPQPGETLLGAGHAVIGLAAGRNGVYLYERAAGQPRELVFVETPLAGWTFIAVVCKGGLLRLYVGGKWLRDVRSTAEQVHAIVGTAPSNELLMTSFEGESSRPDLIERALEPAELRELAARLPPAPDEPPPVQLERREDGMLDLIAWRDGAYALEGSGPLVKLPRVTGAKDFPLDGPWQVHFQPGRGAPAAVTLPSLISLRRHTDFGVRHFAGKAVYQSFFYLEHRELQADRRVYLDLGRVSVMAHVRVNDSGTGVLWKPPYRADITTSVREGRNDVEVTVSTLWTNRLIGDESLPAENEYGPFGAIREIPRWYARQEAKPGQRVTFATWRHYDRDAPLVESGLLGPVRVRIAVANTVDAAEVASAGSRAR
jgi:alpha-L-rhamnosidase